MTAHEETRQAGFSLVELLIAMTVTLIITGAVYGLLASGQNAFRREPELTDRQQNIRVAMDLIMRDLQGAGAGMGVATQTYRAGFNGAGETVAGVATDVLEFLANSGACPDMVVQAADTSTSTVTSASNVPACHGNAGLVNILSPGPPAGSVWGWATGIRATTSDRDYVFPAAINTKFGSAIQTGAALAGAANGFYGSMELVRYQVATGSGDTMPSLWRSERGGRDTSGDPVNPAGANPANGGWQAVARGIEDLQIQYLVNGAWVDEPVAIDPVNLPTTVASQVRVNLGARSEARNVAGATTAGGQTFLRGRLVGVSVPRAGLIALASPGPWQ